MIELAVALSLILLGIFAALAWRFDKERGNTCIHCHKPGGGHNDCCIEVRYER